MRLTSMASLPRPTEFLEVWLSHHYLLWPTYHNLMARQILVSARTPGPFTYSRDAEGLCL
jgi:hypothetical protein